MPITCEKQRYTVANASRMTLNVIGDGTLLGKGTPDEVRTSADPYLKQFVNALPDGPVRFHFPGPPLEEDLRIHG